MAEDEKKELRAKERREDENQTEDQINFKGLNFVLLSKVRAEIEKKKFEIERKLMASENTEMSPLGKSIIRVFCEDLHPDNLKFKQKLLESISMPSKRRGMRFANKTITYSFDLSSSNLPVLIIQDAEKNEDKHLTWYQPSDSTIKLVKTSFNKSDENAEENPAENNKEINEEEEDVFPGAEKITVEEAVADLLRRKKEKREASADELEAITNFKELLKKEKILETRSAAQTVNSQKAGLLVKLQQQNQAEISTTNSAVKGDFNTVLTRRNDDADLDLSDEDIISTMKDKKKRPRSAKSSNVEAKRQWVQIQNILEKRKPTPK